MPMAHAMKVRKVSATQFRDGLKQQLRAVKNDKVLLIQNRRQQAKYVVDREFLDRLVAERDSILATLEILADRQLTNRLVELKKRGLAKARLFSIDEVFG